MNAFVLLACAAIAFASPAAESRPAVIVVVGAEGTKEFGRQFREWSARWSDAAKRGHADFITIGLEDSGAESDREQLKKRLSENAGSGSQSLWLVLIGHGTFDGKAAKFNLRGSDVSATELKEWLAPFERPLAVINCASSSGPFLNELSGRNRVVITSTKSGHEYNFARFGEFLSAAIGDPQADLDKDEQTSLLEAFLLASSRVSEFYAHEGRLVTEHALLDDNADRLGTPADWFHGVRAIKSAQAGASVDGSKASRFHLVSSPQEEQLSATVRERRDQLEQDLIQLRNQKSELAEDKYLQLIEPVLLELSRIYESGPQSQ